MEGNLLKKGLIRVLKSFIVLFLLVIVIIIIYLIPVWIHFMQQVQVGKL